MSNSPTEAAIKAAGRSLSEVARSFGFQVYPVSSQLGH